jgi:hypothetical protein
MNEIQELEAKNSELVEVVFESLKLLDAVKVSNYFSDFASLDSIGDNIPPVVGREAILDYFRNVFAVTKDIEFELVGKPVANGSIVLVKQINRFEMDGIQHNDLYVSAVYVVNGKINKWIAHLQQS